MSERGGKGIGSAIAWLVFPAVPTLLATWYYDALSLGDDPRRWEGFQRWATELGPLIGFGFLAGATARLPDDPTLRGWRSIPRRRSVWVAVGPWLGPGLYLAAVSIALQIMIRTMTLEELGRPMPPFWEWLTTVVGRVAVYGWVAFAVAALRRARRRGRFWRALRDGLLTAIGFVGSLIGGFWAATELWRSYFFDPRIARTLLIVALGATLLSGCATVTVGDVRRRELFHSMLMAWVLGLALLWRWWARPRPGDRGAG